MFPDPCNPQVEVLQNLKWQENSIGKELGNFELPQRQHCTGGSRGRWGKEKQGRGGKCQAKHAAGQAEAGQAECPTRVIGASHEYRSEPG